MRSTAAPATGQDLRGGETGGPNLLRSQLALTDLHGELIIPLVKNGRETPGTPPMPALQIPDADIVAIAEHIHAVQATSRGQGSPPAGPPVQLNIVAGDAKAGQAYFNATCSTCHTLQSMQGIATRIPDPMQLQNTWVAGGGWARRGRGGASRVTVEVTPPNGQRIEGPLVRYDDFIVVLTMPDGTQRSFARNGDVPEGGGEGSARRAPEPAADLHRQGHARRDRFPGDPEMRLQMPRSRSAVALGASPG